MAYDATTKRIYNPIEYGLPGNAWTVQERVPSRQQIPEWQWFNDLFLVDPTKNMHSPEWCGWIWSSRPLASLTRR